MSPISVATAAPSGPRLEFLQNGSTDLHRVTIEHSPFKIGRCETSDLRIDSAQVSREHAQIFQRGNVWTIRDLGSTNGTQVNGKMVHEAVLVDGDILAIAETELTFVASSVTPFQRMLTQPIQHRESGRHPPSLPPAIFQMRALTAATLSQTIPLQMATVVSLANGQCEACFAQLVDTTNLFDPDSHLAPSHPVSKRYCELARLRAVEMAQAQTTASRVFVTVEFAEFEAPEQLFSNLEQLRDGLAVDCELGVAITFPKILDPSALYDISREVRKAELLLGITNFQGSIAQIVDLALCAPDYLVLSDAMVQGLSTSSQPLHRLKLVFTTCHELGITPVLPHCTCQ
ncbi:MAG TPA: FHA domain-containing protein, partial [Pirellulales bacterium]